MNERVCTWTLFVCGFSPVVGRDQKCRRLIAGSVLLWAMAQEAFSFFVHCPFAMLRQTKQPAKEHHSSPLNQTFSYVFQLAQSVSFTSFFFPPPSSWAGAISQCGVSNYSPFLVTTWLPSLRNGRFLNCFNSGRFVSGFAFRRIQV